MIVFSLETDRQTEPGWKDIFHLFSHSANLSRSRPLQIVAVDGGKVAMVSPANSQTVAPRAKSLV